MVELLFIPEKLPRTWTKKQWKEAYRWARQTRKILDKQIEQQLKLLAIYGTTHPEVYSTMVNPPLLLGPGMEDIEW